MVSKWISFTEIDNMKMEKTEQDYIAGICTESKTNGKAVNPFTN